METLNVKDLKTSKVFARPVGFVDPAVVLDNLKDVGDDATDLTHWVDFHADYHQPGGFDWADLTLKLDQEKPNYAELPEPLCPKSLLPQGTKMQIAIMDIPGNNDHFAIFKWYTFPAKASKNIAIAATSGTCKMLSIAGGKASAQYFHYLFENMGGWQARTRDLQLKIKEISESKAGTGTSC